MLETYDWMLVIYAIPLSSNPYIRDKKLRKFETVKFSAVSIIVTIICLCVFFHMQ